MKKITFLFLFFSFGITFSQEFNKTEKDAKGKLFLIGKTNRKAFDTDNFSWFQENYDAYLTNDNVIKQCKDSLKNYTVKVFYGTWCGDSRRELPRFYKVLDKANIKASQIEAVAVDKKPEAYKASPNGEEKGLNIHRVPTFIFYKNGKEINRIVEYPRQDFERDIHKIVNGEKYTSHYFVANYLENTITEKGIDSLRLQEKKLIPQLANFTEGSKELNTYGYKLLRSNQIEKALYIFDLNTKMYPYNSNVFDSLGEAFYTTKNYTEALKNYGKVLALTPDDKNALEMIEKIKKDKSEN